MINTTTNSSVPYWKLSGFYFFYFVSLGVLIPYWSLYLKSLGYSSLIIGSLIAIIPATKFIAPYIWGWIADHTRRSMLIIRVASVLALFSFLLVFISDELWWLTVTMFLFSFFWNAILPQFEAMTLNHLGNDTHRYSMIRLWGSLGFIVIVVLIGDLLQSYDADIIPLVVLISFIVIALTSFLVPEKLNTPHFDHSPIWHVIKQPKVLAFLAVCFLMLCSHGPYYTFYTIYLETQGYSLHIIGVLWAVGVFAEVIIFLIMHRLLPVFGARKLLIVTLLLTTVRWLLIGFFVDSLPMLFLAQLIHAFSFGMFHAIGISLVHDYFTGSHQGRGQALYASTSFGAGVAIGSLVSGMLWDRGGAEILFVFASLCTLLATVIVWKFIQPLNSGRKIHQ
ncbi:Nucleoside:H+ symporter:Major facilitator superfamily [hydrothermal vent metagenome]|uniref:Nucleoside:H+ symporter:Major facilitator superfamily n=1 Tax=hydrothermal vent metagenome TaxID=652676 RepID=A0A3B0WL01_9ZZZZ